jgi:uncharacterized protein (TIGR03085 family)
VNWARHERHALADLLVQTGPDAPTLCAGWTTRDLAAHLVIRDRRPDAAIGLVVKPLASHTHDVQEKAAAQPWDTLVEQVRSGPPAWLPPAWEPVDRTVNTIEYFVHHEDVRRAQTGWEPRPAEPDLEDELWRRLRVGARLFARRSPVGLVLRRPNGGEVTAKAKEPTVTVAGPASELTLFVYGRQDHARVDIVGPDDLVTEVRAARLGI